MFKTFRKITNNHSSSFSQQQTPTTNIQEERIRMNINLAYVEGTGEKLWHILISHKIRSTFNFESTLCKLLCKLKDLAATEDKANMVFKWSLKLLSDEPKNYVKNCDCEKNETAKYCWEADPSISCDQKKVVDRESRLIPRKIKETIHSLKNPNHINNIFYILPEISFPNLL